MLSQIKDGETLQDLLLRGDIDALLAPNPPKAFLDGNPEIVRIVKDFGSAERAYHKKTGFFPIMHLIAVRKSLVDENPDLPVALLGAFTEARDIAMQDLREVWLGSANRLSLPWLNEAMEKTMSSMGLGLLAIWLCAKPKRTRGCLQILN